MYPPPIRTEGIIPFYTSSQLLVFGLPEDSGIQVYQVISLREDEEPMVMDYPMMQDRYFRKRHMYDRYARFKDVLLKLATLKCDLHPTLPTYLDSILPTKNPDTLWWDIRRMMKSMGIIEYNQIPSVAKAMGFSVIVPWSVIEKILVEFREINCKFDKAIRPYFPNLRFVALTLLTRHVEFPYKVMMLKTKRKIRDLELLLGNILVL